MQVCFCEKAILWSFIKPNPSETPPSSASKSLTKLAPYPSLFCFQTLSHPASKLHLSLPFIALPHSASKPRHTLLTNPASSVLPHFVRLRNKCLNVVSTASHIKTWMAAPKVGDPFKEVRDSLYPRDTLCSHIQSYTE